MFCEQPSQAIEAEEFFARVLRLRHAVGEQHARYK